MSETFNYFYTAGMFIEYTASIIATCVDFAQDQDKRKGERVEKVFSEKIHLETPHIITIDRYVSKYLYASEYFILKAICNIVAISNIPPPHFRENTTGRNADMDDRWEVEAAILSINRT